MDPKELKYLETHEWCRIEGNLVTIGITDRLARQIGDVIYIEMPDPDDDILTDEPWGEIESFQSVVPLHSPADGRVAKVNFRLCDDPEVLLADPYGEGWLISIQVPNPSTMRELLSYEEYQARLKAT